VQMAGEVDLLKSTRRLILSIHSISVNAAQFHLRHVHQVLDKENKCDHTQAQGPTEARQTDHLFKAVAPLLGNIMLLWDHILAQVCHNPRLQGHHHLNPNESPIQTTQVLDLHCLQRNRV
jgi:hypothetical protein